MSNTDLIRRLEKMIPYEGSEEDIDAAISTIKALSARSEAAEAEVARLKDQIYESIPQWQANELQRKLDAAETALRVAETLRDGAEADAKKLAVRADAAEWELERVVENVKAADARAERAEAALKSAQAWLGRWGSHAWRCDEKDHCSCGLNRVRREITALLEAKP